VHGVPDPWGGPAAVRTLEHYPTGLNHMSGVILRRG
jgi:hypothetical protein